MVSNADGWLEQYFETADWSSEVVVKEPFKVRLLLGDGLRLGWLVGCIEQFSQETAPEQKSIAVVAPLEIQVPSRHWLNELA